MKIQENYRIIRMGERENIMGRSYKSRGETKQTPNIRMEEAKSKRKKMG